ncbi:aromatic/alkene monooxygenase hydroxylase subunit beta [Amphritea japonica]|uniref:Phenol hydroxylase P1 protein n=1 Tax=Amphritea japonica ATCC BAA-1530 TaxID=1278309 RepID=A0A7R6STS2_9GAMM|nr:aromatic/alkene monooxygenase hydroxylase subunit beta [Amphritea japonica]BBB27595.1 phenol hydroxylase P1 protein [Amphritea japonica ATCC BAA-1530]
MTIEIKTATLEPVRNTFAHIERRFGDKPATRYQEATYDVASEVNFHYRPLWQPEYELNDTGRTAIVMEDWYAFKDPRQFYYGTYVQMRAKQQEIAESNYSFFEKRDLARLIPEEVQQKVIRLLIPLRHVEQAANLNNVYGSSLGYGTAITQALLYNGMDRLGNAQYLSRIGLILDGNSSDSLTEAKRCWMDDAIWQGLRAYCEANICVEDWFESFVAQDVVLDALIYELVYLQFDQWLADNGGQDISMLTEFIQNWNKDTNRWVDSVVKVAAAESDANKQQLEQWIGHWKGKAIEALAPLAEEMLDAEALNNAVAAMDKRLNKAGLFK